MSASPSCYGLGLALSVLCLAFPAAHARAPGSFSCGAPASAVQPLAKGSALPDTVKGDMRVILFRVGFKDAPYTNDSAALAATLTRMARFYKDNSAGAFNLIVKVQPGILILPGVRNDYNKPFSDAQFKAGFAAAVTRKIDSLGLVRGRDWDRGMFSFTLPNLGWGGSSDGPKGHYEFINEIFDPGVTTHELGHGLGLPHATALDLGTEIIGTGGYQGRMEYGDYCDVMGYAPYVDAHFSTMYKKRLGWVLESETVRPLQSGTVRIYSHDNPVKSGKPVALRLPSSAAYTYWIEYRTNLARTLSNNRNGAEVRVEGYYPQDAPVGPNSVLLDMTPASHTPEEWDVIDGHLEVGREYREKNGVFTLKVLAQNPGVWNQEGWLDLQVTYGASIVARRPDRDQGLSPLPGSAGFAPLDGSRPGWNLLGRAYGSQANKARGIYVLTAEAAAR